ncbi:MAG: Yip1 family protein [Pseudomonadota bacterium]
MGNLFQRVTNILKSPKTEWPVIAAEPATVGSLYVPYVLLLAAIGPVAMILGGGGTGFFRFSSAILLRIGVWQYISSLLSVALFALVINFLAPQFGATKNTVQAFKTAVYASTAAWIGAVGGLLGFGLGTLLGVAGAVYSIYLLYLALPHTMKAPPEKATTYVVVIIVAYIVIAILLAVIGSGLGMSRMGLAGLGGMRTAQHDVQTFDPDSPLGRLESAGRNLEQADKAGKLKDPSQAMGQVMGALAGASGGTVEAVDTETLKSFLPQTLAGLPRKSISAERNAAMGMQFAVAHARYGDDGHDVKLQITDTGGAAGFMAMAGWANVESSSEEGTRTERVGHEGDRLVKEVWDSASKSGEYTVVVGKRFMVEAQGGTASIADLKAAAAAVDLARLESLRNAGVKHE